MQRLFSFFLPLVAAVTLIQGPASAAGDHVRHLKYAFDIGVRNDSYEHKSQVTYVNDTLGGTVGGASLKTDSGNTHYAGASADKGEIAVDVIGVQPDGALVARVTEDAHGPRSTPPVTCLIYDTTKVTCGSAALHPEAIAVLRTLSPKFYDTKNLDAKQHWHVVDDQAKAQSDFTLVNRDGSLVTIEGRRTEDIAANERGSSESSLKYVYDSLADVPKSIAEYATIRHETDAGKYTNITVDITARLLYDSATAGQ